MLFGTNIAGGEVDYGSANTTNPVSGTDYLFITHQDIDYLASKNISFVRLLFSWECLQQQLNQPLTSNTYNTTMQDRVTYLTSKGITVMIEIHGASDGNFARYKGNLVGSTAVPNSAFADFWSRVATIYKGNSKVVFGLTNEPNNMSTVQWFAAAQAAINGIRSASANNMIMVPGNGWTSAESWLDTSVDTATPKIANSTAWLTLTDSANNLACSVHMYFDADDGGGATDIVSATIGVQRVANVISWARTHGIKVHISEFGCSSANSLGPTAVKNFMDNLMANSDVVIGASWWAYGPPSWWSGYIFTLCPKSNYTVDDPKWAWLEPYFTALVPAPTPAPVPVPTPTPVPTPAPTVANISKTSTTAKAPGDQGFTASKTVKAGFSNAPAGTYSLSFNTRTTYSDQNTFCVDVIITNSNANYDLNWNSLQLDMRNHTLLSSSGCTVSGKIGVVTVTPVAGSTIVLANNKVAFNLCFTRATDATSYYQVLVKSVSW